MKYCPKCERGVGLVLDLQKGVCHVCETRLTMILSLQLPVPN